MVRTFISITHNMKYVTNIKQNIIFSKYILYMIILLLSITCTDLTVMSELATNKINNNYNDQHIINYFNSMINCPYSRKSYDCSNNQNYTSWLNNHISDIHMFKQKVKMFGSNTTTTPHSLLFIGNSHTQQLAIMLICGLHELGVISHFKGTNVSSGCVRDMPAGLGCDSGDSHGSCGMYLSSIRLHNGAQIYLANNHPWLFDGKRGLDKMSHHLGIDYTKLAAVVIGAWNDQR